MESPAYLEDLRNRPSSQLGLMSSGGKVPVPRSPGETLVPRLGNEGRRHGLFSSCSEITLKVVENKREVQRGKLESEREEAG